MSWLAPRVQRVLKLVRSLRFDNRWVLIAFISGGQLACLMAGLLWFGGWLRAGLLAQMRQQVLQANEQFAGQAVDMIRRMKLQSLRPGSNDWERLQRIIERTRLPNDGFICVIESEQGRVICHPEVRQNPVWLSMNLGQRMLERPDGYLPINESAHEDAGAQGGVGMPDGRHLVAVRDMPELNIKVLAHQRERMIADVISRMNASIWRIGIAVAALMACGTAGLTLLVVQRYEHELAELNRGLERQVDRRSRALMKTRDAVIFGLARLAESRHEDTGEHLDRIRRYVEVLARHVSRRNPALDEQTIETISIASSLHDIGKVAVPDEVLLKHGKLTPRQREVMRRHTIAGGDCLLAIKRRLGEDDFLTTACQIALSHHERWNGTGYPFGLRETEIPLSGRIVALADVYDALTSDRVYKCAMSHEKARDMIVRSAGKQFDPLIVEAFLSAEQEFARISGQAQGRLSLRAAA